MTATPVAGADLAYRLRSLLERCRFFLCNQAADGAIECRLGDVVVPLCLNTGCASPRKGGLGIQKFGDGAGAGGITLLRQSHAFLGVLDQNSGGLNLFV